MSMMTDTLEVARNQVENIITGKQKGKINCPCCQKQVRLNAQPFDARMGEFMCRLVAQYERTKDFVPVTMLPGFKRVTRNGNYAYLKHWGLITPKESDGTGKTKFNGLWKPTEKGIRFVKNTQETVPSKAYFYNKKVMFWDSQRVTILQTLGRKFDYQRYLAGTL